jgi:ribosomal protein L23
MKGISTNHRTTNNVACLRQAGQDFAACYYSTTTQQPEKRLTLSEAQAISTPGVTIVAVYEDGPTSIVYFSTSRGHQDRVNAYHTAGQILQPSGSAVYFAVNYDATPSDIAQAISDYFRGVGLGPWQTIFSEVHRKRARRSNLLASHSVEKEVLLHIPKSRTRRDASLRVKLSA